MKSKEKEEIAEQNSTKPAREGPAEGKYGPVEEYRFSGIKVYHGIVNKWLWVVYLVLVIWGIYYIFKNWGGLGPGLGF